MSIPSVLSVRHKSVCDSQNHLCETEMNLPECDEFREVKITRVTIVPRGEAIFCERATHVETQDEAAGEYVRIIQQDDRKSATEQTIQIDPAEWPTIRSVIDYMVENCRS